jgi:hypothetical protein
VYRLERNNAHYDDNHEYQEKVDHEDIACGYCPLTACLFWCMRLVRRHGKVRSLGLSRQIEAFCAISITSATSARGQHVSYLGELWLLFGRAQHRDCLRVESESESARLKVWNLERAVMNG